MHGRNKKSVAWSGDASIGQMGKIMLSQKLVFSSSDWFSGSTAASSSAARSES